MRAAFWPMGGKKSSPYEIGELLFESGTPGTYEIKVIAKVNVDISICAGGGGGSGGAGGTGGTLRILTTLDIGNYILQIGSPGIGAGAYVRNNNGYPGGNSSISGPSLAITAVGGTGRNARRNGGGGGTVGSVTYSSSNAVTVIFESSAGASYGLSYLTGDYNGFGAGGQPQGNETGAGYAGKPGYIKIQVVNN